MSNWATDPSWLDELHTQPSSDGDYQTYDHMFLRDCVPSYCREPLLVLDQQVTALEKQTEVLPDLVKQIDLIKKQLQDLTDKVQALSKPVTPSPKT